MQIKKQFKWECVYCGQTCIHSQRIISCSCRSGYVKHIKTEIADSLESAVLTGGKDGMH